jgi:HSP20 family protein
MALATLFGDDLFHPFLHADPRHAVRPNGSQLSTMSRGMPIDVVEKEKTIEIKADVPGVNKDDIKLNVEGDVLSISVQRENKTEDKEEEGVKYHRSERSMMYANRALRLPETADLEHVKAKYENGVLEVEVPKLEEKERSRRIDIA